MNRIEAKFKELKRSRRKAFIAYITAGDPNLAATLNLVRTLETAGVDILELGIPFSDPLADGPVIQAASKRALDKGATLRKIFTVVRKARAGTNMPIAFMTYYNPVLRYGLDAFIRDCSTSGVDGVIIPDLPFEEAASLVKTARRNKIATIFLAAPTSTRKRMRGIARSSSGFIYYVSLTGVTGARRRLPEEIGRNVRILKSLTKMPVCVGFGVSNAAQARSIARVADGVIVGSAIVKVIEENRGNAKRMFSEVKRFAASLARAIHKDA
jgi:tryptophan synthase alpha chain